MSSLYNNIYRTICSVSSILYRFSQKVNHGVNMKKCNKISTGFTSTQLKRIALGAMFFDHFVGVFISHDTIWGMALRIPGRIVAPIMCYMISEGFYHTSDIKKYLRRLYFFALISHIPFNLCIGMGFPTTSVMCGLALGLTALVAVKKESLRLIYKLGAVLICCALSFYANWNFVAVLWIVFFGIYHGNFKKQMIAFSVIGFLLHIVPTFTYLDFGFEHSTQPHWYQIFIFMAIPLLAMYNGKKGTTSRAAAQFFYWFYPLHLLLIYALRLIFLP